MLDSKNKYFFFTFLISSSIFLLLSSKSKISFLSFIYYSFCFPNCSKIINFSYISNPTSQQTFSSSKSSFLKLFYLNYFCLLIEFFQVFYFLICFPFLINWVLYLKINFLRFIFLIPRFLHLFSFHRFFLSPFLSYDIYYQFFYF